MITIYLCNGYNCILKDYFPLNFMYFIYKLTTNSTRNRDSYYCSYKNNSILTRASIFHRYRRKKSDLFQQYYY